MTTLADITLRIANVEAQIEQLTRRELRETAIELNDYATEIAHKRSGRMALTQHVEGIVEIGKGTLEASSVPGVDYAELEVAHGGDHAYDERTLADQSRKIDALSALLEQQIARLIEGA